MMKIRDSFIPDLSLILLRGEMGWGEFSCLFLIPIQAQTAPIALFHPPTIKHLLPKV